jgi:hypothetical protein
MRVFYPVWQVAELAARYRYTTQRAGPADPTLRRDEVEDVSPRQILLITFEKREELH